ncbi:hypothetical protein KP806_05215 [Paenibacillus sp. N4]|uniref:hypothetical protein n=1 Tax=Paenibacillus vietnamensis TaxID=2590547 RepID=UPI001CD07CC8|nr:hypothetical protein [Paenibacillus vietnamensis]MCA0754440.1 hypothetical protein [Paenibacillus vietnamensis]
MKRHPSINKSNRKQLIRLTDEVSSVLKKVIIFLLILLACSQAALQNDWVRQLLTSVDKWEGEPLS